MYRASPHRRFTTAPPPSRRVQAKRRRRQNLLTGFAVFLLFVVAGWFLLDAPTSHGNEDALEKQARLPTDDATADPVSTSTPTVDGLTGEGNLPVRGDGTRHDENGVLKDTTVITDQAVQSVAPVQPRRTRQPLQKPLPGNEGPPLGEHVNHDADANTAQTTTPAPDSPPSPLLPRHDQLTKPKQNGGQDAERHLPKTGRTDVNELNGRNTHRNSIVNGGGGATEYTPLPPITFPPGQRRTPQMAVALPEPGAAARVLQPTVPPSTVRECMAQAEAALATPFVLPTTNVQRKQRKGKDNGVHTPPTDQQGGDRVVLFGTVKPLKQLAAEDPNDPYDSFLITQRTLWNWAAIPGIQPVLLFDDDGNRLLIEQLNTAPPGTPRRAQHPIHYLTEFEQHSQFRQPTYRGLFRAVLNAYPAAEVIVFSNTDILYTSDLYKTISAVQAHYQCVVQPSNPKMRGFFIAGRRSNTVVPVSWPWDALTEPSTSREKWERRLKKYYYGKALFMPDAEDYFAMTRDMFDWFNDIPDYVVGGSGFDNWLTAKAIELGMRGEAFVVEATDTVQAVHQNHDANVLASKKKPKSQYNLQMMGKEGKIKFFSKMGRTTRCPFRTAWQQESLEGHVDTADRKAVTILPQRKRNKYV